MREKKERFLLWLIVFLFSGELKKLNVERKNLRRGYNHCRLRHVMSVKFQKCVEKIISLLKCLATDNGNKRERCFLFYGQISPSAKIMILTIS